MNDDILIRAENVSKKFCRSLKRSLWYGLQDSVGDLLGRDTGGRDLRRDEFWAVDDVSFELRRGECLGLIGRNGAGKTTLLKMLNGLIKPDSGRIEMRGRVGALIALGAGFNPILTGRENIYVNGSVLGLSKKEIDTKYDEIVDFAEIGEFIDSPVQSYSSGMQVRLGFAIATAMEPDILLLDEVLAVGDANFQAKCYKRLGSMLDRAAVILVSHYPHHIVKVCDTALLLRRGQKILEDSPLNVINAYNALSTTESGEVPVNSLSLLSDKIASARISCLTPQVSHGGKLELNLELDVREATFCDQAYLNIVDRADNVHAQVILRGLIGPLSPGKFDYRVSVFPLHISKDSFRAHFAMWGSGGKETLVHLRNQIAFENSGPTSLGPYYYPECQITKTEHLEVAHKILEHTKEGVHAIK